MGCGPGVAGKSRSAGVFAVSLIFSTRTPGSIMCESDSPCTQADDGRRDDQSVVPLPETSNSDRRSSAGFQFVFHIPPARSVASAGYAAALRVAGRARSSRDARKEPLSRIPADLCTGRVEVDEINRVL